VGFAPGKSFQYLTPKWRIAPRDLLDTSLFRSATLHFICSPTRAAVIMSQVAEVEDWSPISVYEPIPDRCVSEELPALRDVLPLISVLSPNAEEALSLLADPSPVSKSSIERASKSFLDFGVGPGGTGTVVVRSGSLGAYVASRSQPGAWIDAYWRAEERVVDVTGDFLSHGVNPRAYHLVTPPRGGQQFSGWPCRRPRVDKRRCL